MTTKTCYRIETGRLVMRCWSPNDAPRLRALIDSSDQHLRPYIAWMQDEPMPLAQTAERLREARAKFDRDERYDFAVLDRDETTLLGEAGLFPRVGKGALEVGYWIGAGHTRQGYASEATAALVRVAFKAARVDRVELHCDPANAASMTIAQRLGFSHEATLHRRFRLNDRYFDSAIWVLFADGYAAGPAASSGPVRAFDCMGMQIV